MLQGTFETLSLPEVLGLLSSARKSGALWLDAGPISGVAHLEDGHCHAAEAGDQRGPLDSGPALLTRLVDMCFAVMCQESGSFRFAADDPPPWTCAEQVQLSDVLVEVDRLLKQWREILRVIPSLECRPQLLDALEVDELLIDRDRWALLVATDGRRTVRELVHRTGRPVIELCQMLLELVEVGAVGVIDPAAARAPDADLARSEPPSPEVFGLEDPASSAAVVDAQPVPQPDDPRTVVSTSEVSSVEPPRPPEADAPAVVLTIVPEPQPDDPQPEPAPEPQPPSGAAETPDKGAFLRLFSGLRDS